MDNNLEGISVTPDLFPKTSKKVPDVNFYYRCLSLQALFIEWGKKITALSFLLSVLFGVRSLETTSSCESGRSVVVTLRCNPDKSTTGELSVPRSFSSTSL